MKPHKPSTAGWRTIGHVKHYMRSKWEANYGRYLQFLKTHGNISSWQHEPKTFWFEGIKRGVCSYKPDFQVFELDGSHHWVEVKGFMDSKSATKLKRFKKYFPEERLVLIDAKWFARNGKKLRGLIPFWE